MILSGDRYAQAMSDAAHAAAASRTAGFRTPRRKPLLVAAAERENILLSFMSGIRPVRAPTAGYNAYADPSVNLRPWDRHKDLFYQSRSTEETNDLIAQLEREELNRRTIDQAGFMGWLASIGAGMSSPENFLPFGTAVGRVRRGAGALRTGLATARVGFVASATAEVGLQATQESRTLAESSANVIASTVLVGTIGTIAGGLGSIGVERAKLLQGVMSREIELGPLHERVERELPEGFYQIKEIEEQRRVVLETIGRVDKDALALVKLRGPLGLAVEGMVRLSPGSRLASGVSVIERVLGTKLSRTGIWQKGMADLGQSTDAKKRVLEVYGSNARNEVQDIYAQYKQAKAATEGNVPTLPKEKFHLELFRTFFRDDEATQYPAGSIERTFLEKAAKAGRKELWEPYLEVGIATGLFSRNEVPVSRGYAHSMLDKARIRGDQPGFIEFLHEHGFPRGTDDAEQFTMSLINHPRELFFEHIREPAPFKEIALKIPREALLDEGWIISDFDLVVQRYVNATSGDLAMALDWRTGTGKLLGVALELENLGKRLEGLEPAAASRELTLYRERLDDYEAGYTLSSRLQEDTSVAARRIEALADERDRLTRQLADEELNRPTVIDEAGRREAQALRDRVDEMDAELIRLREEAVELREAGDIERGRTLEDAQAASEERLEGLSIPRRLITRRRKFVEARDKPRVPPEGVIGTKVVDAAGEPALVFHGTSTASDVLQLEDRRGIGAIFFTRSRASAQKRAEFVAKRDGGEPRVLEAYVDIRNPAPKGAGLRRERLDPEGVTLEKFDGLIDGDEVAVFDRSQIFQPVPGIRTAAQRAGFTRRLAALRRAFLAENPRTEPQAFEDFLAADPRAVFLARERRLGDLKVGEDTVRVVEDEVEALRTQLEEAEARANQRAIQDEAALAEFEETVAPIKKELDRVAADAKRDRAFAHRVALRDRKSEALRLTKERPPIKATSDEEVAASLERLTNRATRLRRQESQDAIELIHQLRKMDDEYLEIGKGLSPRKRKRLEGRKKRRRADIDAIRRVILNMDSLRSDPYHWAFSLERIARTMSFVTRMGKVMIASMPDISMHLFVNGWGPYMRGIKNVLGDPDFITSMKTLKDKDELSWMIAGLESQFGGSRITKMGDIDDPSAPSNVVERAMNVFADKFTTATGMRWWNPRMKALAAHIAQNRIARDVHEWVATGTLDAARMGNLELAGIGFRLANRLVEQMKKMEGVKDGKDWWPQSTRWEDQGVARAFQAAVIEDVERTIITPSAGDRPRFMSIPFMRLAGQFKTFAVAANNKIVVSGLQRRDGAVLSGLTGMITMGAMVYALRSVIAGREVSDDWRVWMIEAVDRSGATGIGGDLNNTLEKLTGGTLGVNAALTGTNRVTSRYRARSIFDTILGPSAGLARDIFSIVNSPFRPGEFSQAELERLRRLIPGMELWYLSNLSRAASQHLGEELGLPQKTGQ